MRLTCPNCGAQYEVPDDVIPDDGRDVQCSNCGTTWFQPHPNAVAPEPPTPEPDTSDLRAALGRGDPPSPPEPEQTEPELPDQVPVSAPPKPERRGLDPEVQDILQEEAAHETRLRAQEAGGLETQPDLGLDDTTDDVERRAREARARMERLKGPAETTEPTIEKAVAEATAAAAAVKSSRRDRLPDIDEINSSLRRSDNAGASQTIEDDLSIEEAPSRRGGFARGFAIPLIVVTALVLVYVNAATLAETVPAAGPALTRFVLLVDQGRVWLDSQISAFLP